MASTAPNGSSRGTRAVMQSPNTGDARPNPAEMIAHPLKTVRFMNALRRDKRISWIRKALYIGPMLVLLVAMLVPEGIVAGAVAVVLPFVGPAFDIPADAVVDWLVIGLAAYGLLAVLPRIIMAEHHQRIFHKGRAATH
jgi:hypothetical protein